MKKTLFTVSTIGLLCVAIIFACKKEDNSGETQVSYASHNGGTGNNPDPNHTNTTSGTITSGSTTSGTTSGTTTSGTTSGTTTSGTTTTTYTVAIDAGTGPSTGTVSAPSCSSNYMSCSSNNSQITNISIGFSAGITVGNTYNVVSSNPNSSQVTVSVNSTYASSGSVTITSSGGKNVATFNNVVVTSPATYTLTGSMSCP